MMTNDSGWRSRPRWRIFPFSIGLGTVLGGLALAGGDTGMALFSVALLSAFGAVLAFTNWEWSVIQGPTADERQTTINLRAVETAYLAVISVAVSGFCVEIFRGTPGPFTLVASVGGFTHMSAIAVLRRRS